MELHMELHMEFQMELHLELHMNLQMGLHMEFHMEPIWRSIWIAILSSIWFHTEPTFGLAGCVVATSMVTSAMSGMLGSGCCPGASWLFKRDCWVTRVGFFGDS